MIVHIHAFLLFFALVAAQPGGEPVNRLSDEETQAGWRLLFDGKTTEGWRGYKMDKMPPGWKVIDGALVRVSGGAGGKGAGGGDDIITVQQFGDFELKLQWKIVDRAGNSGIVLRASEDAVTSWHTGPEMQILDNAAYRGRDVRQLAGACYDLYAPVKDTSRPRGQWNAVRVVADGRHIEHWLNGVKLLEYELGSDDWNARVAKSKFRKMERFHNPPMKGHICLQDHTARIEYRNIKIRVPSPPAPLPKRERGVAQEPLKGERFLKSERFLKTERFDTDPGWEGFNNRIVPKQYPTIVQDFGYSKTNFAGKTLGEMGGQVCRASEPAYYADKIGPKTLDDKLSASGSFTLTKTTPGSGMFFGFFKAEQPGGGGRPINSLGMDMDCEHSGARLAVRLITGRNQSCGTFITPFIPGKFRPTPIRNDGTRYTWKLDYDPRAADGRGRFTFTLTSDAHQPGELEKADLPESHKQEARRRFPSVTTFSVDLPEGFKRQHATFDHFGLMNMMKAGGRMTIHFDDLQYEGRSEDFAHEPNWDASGNRRSYKATDVGGAHNFGFSKTNHAGGTPGEIGGSFWRGGPYGYYADRVGLLTLDDRLEAGGRVVLAAGAPDSDMYLGWFSSAVKDRSPAHAGNFLGIHVGGPTRVGHYFQPVFAVANGARGKTDQGPVLVPGKVCEWSLVYDPAADGGHRAIRVTLSGESVTLRLKPGHKAQGAAFDRFGLLTSDTGGGLVRIFLDDLKYTAARPSP